jgi:signal transduction histidine kinase
VNPLRSVGARLSLALLLVVAGALGFVYLIVVPSLEDRLVDAKLAALERSAPTLARQLASNPFDPDFVENAAATANARVIVYGRLSDMPPSLSVLDDSRGGLNSAGVENDPLAMRASLGLESHSGTLVRNGERFAEVAVPVGREGTVLLLSAPLSEALADVRLVRRRLLAAGGLALALALAVGYGAAWLFARRIRRLGHAADRIASGRFDEPVTDRSPDELGELARRFERMRLRLAQLDHARREFIANASHELRTPIFALGGFLELLTEEEDERVQREFLASAREQVDRLTKLAGELLDLSRLDAGQLAVRREPVRLAGLAGAVAEEFGAVARTTGRVLEVEAVGDPVAAADEERVRQIGRILVENALVHTPVGTEVRIRVSREDGRVALVVEDLGPGIPPEQAPHVFERFYRVDGGQARGSGLGLAIARELTELMGGSLELEAHPGRTVFTVLLPQADDELISQPDGADRASRENGDRAARGGETTSAGAR